MAREPRVVAELGRPETPQETADRKAAASRTYRSSQTARNLIAALIVTVAVVAVVIFAVPRGTPPERPEIDVAAAAAEAEAIEGRALLVPVGLESWRVNSAAVAPDEVRAWTIVYAPTDGFLRIAQGFEADDGWPSRVLRGASSTETVTIDGIVWDRYEIANPESAGNINGALATRAGSDIVFIYGLTTPDAYETAAAAVADGVRALDKEGP